MNWGKFKSLLPILLSKHVLLKPRGKLYSAVARSAMLHDIETWAPTVCDKEREQLNALGITPPEPDELDVLLEEIIESEKLADENRAKRKNKTKLLQKM